MLPKLASIKEYDMNYQQFSVLPIEVNSKIKEQLMILDEAYGVGRSSIENIGGYIQVIQTASQWKEFIKTEQIDKELYEFVEFISIEYVYMVYVVGNDFSIGVITPKDVLMNYKR